MANRSPMNGIGIAIIATWRILLLPVSVLICRAAPFGRYKKHLLSTWQLSQSRSPLDSLLFRPFLWYWTKFEYRRERAPDRRENLKSLVMDGKSGKAFAKGFDASPVDLKRMVGRLTFGELVPVLQKADAFLASASKPMLVCQIGSSSGREIAWLATRNSAHTYIGTDVFEDVVTYASEHYDLPNLSFQTCPAKDISSLMSRYEYSEIIVFSHGSLQYVQPEHVRPFFESLKRFPGLQVMLAEPAEDINGGIEGLNGSRWRGTLTASHDYRFYAESVGIVTKESHILRARPGKGKVTYFYWGTSN